VVPDAAIRAAPVELKPVHHTLENMRELPMMPKAKRIIGERYIHMIKATR
jgi:hypothetical protein